MAVAIIIPSYNEEDNLRILVRRIRNHYPDYPIIIVDDSEPDRSRKFANELSAAHRHVHVISRQTKSGRGSAVIDGLKYAIRDRKTKYFIEMDADLSHNPDEIAVLLEQIASCGVVIASRYLPQSRIINWPLRRRILSKYINVLLRSALGIPVSDFTNGFRAYSRDAVQYLTSATLVETGFIALSEWLVVLHRAGLSICDVPSTFTDRTHGKSNAGLAEHVNALRGVIRLWLSSR